VRVIIQYVTWRIIYPANIFIFYEFEITIKTIYHYI